MNEHPSIPTARDPEPSTRGQHESPPEGPEEPPARVPLNYPPLRASDVEMISTITGVEFAWPPAAGEVFPSVASDIASARRQASRAGRPWGDLTAANLHALHRQGLIDTEFLDHAVNYLSAQPRPGQTTAPAHPDGTAPMPQEWVDRSRAISTSNG